MFTQKTNLVLKVKSMEVKKIQKEENEYIILETKGSILPSGMLVTVSKLFNTSKKLHEFIEAKIEEFEGMASRFKNLPETQRSYVSINVKPKIVVKQGTGEKEIVMYDKIHHDILDDGREFLKIDGWVNSVKHTQIDEDFKNDVLKFEYQRGGAREVKVGDFQDTVITAEMYVLAYDDERGRVELTSGGNYPISLVCYKDPEATIKGSPTIGQMYEFSLYIKKGQRISLKEESLSEETDWDNEEKIEKKGFEPDILIINKIRIIKGEVLSGLDDNNELDAVLDGLM